MKKFVPGEQVYVRDLKDSAVAPYRATVVGYINPEEHNKGWIVVAVGDISHLIKQGWGIRHLPKQRYVLDKALTKVPELELLAEAGKQLEDAV